LWFKASPRQKRESLYKKITKRKKKKKKTGRGGGGARKAQVVERLPSKCKVLVQTPVPQKEKKKKNVHSTDEIIKGKANANGFYFLYQFARFLLLV
jgi:hypothetical protein